MKVVVASLILFQGLVCGVTPLRGATVFQDGFESGALPPWSVSSPSSGRAAIRSDFGPATGEAHLILDDSLSDAVFSVAEATLTLDLSNKKNVVLSFKAKSLGNEAHPAPEGTFAGTQNYDGVAISINGGATWRTAQSLVAVPGAWTNFDVTLDPIVTALGGGFGPGLMIRFSQYDNASAPLDGIAIDDVLVSADDDQQAVLELPGPLLEGTGPHLGYLLLAFPPSSPLTVALSSSPDGELSLPSTVTIPAGQTYASFEFSVQNDSFVNLARTITVRAAADAFGATQADIVVTDDDVPVATLTLPDQLAEDSAASSSATFAIDKIATSAFKVKLTADPSNELSLPAAVTIPPGESQVAFTVRALDDARIDGNVNVTVTASAAGMASVSASTTTIDDEARLLGLVVPESIGEGGASTGVVTIPGSLTSALEVSLASADQAALSVPATVTIPAGETQATFAITAADNPLRDGSRSVNLTATARAFTGASRPVVVRDNDPATYRFSALGNLLNITAPPAVSVSAVDIEGRIISNFSGPVNLSVVLPDGTTRPLAPASVTLSGPGWSGSVAFPAVGVSPLRLRASDASGYSGDSNPFDILRTLALQATDLVWDSTRNRIYASVPANATGPHANKVVAIDPVTLQVVASAATNQNPGQLALTSGGEALYVALNDNGTIARINPSTMTVTSTFAVGTDPNYGTLYAADICTVAGQPNMLVVSQDRKNVSPSHNGVAAYENGVRRPSKTQDHTGSNKIEPSSDPTLFFGYNTGSSEFGFRRLRLGASGMTQLDVNTSLLSGYGTDMRSDGDMVFSTEGVILDGAQMKRLGSLGTSGLVRPDSAIGRVFFLERPQGYSTFHTLAAYDPRTFTLVRRISLPSPLTNPASLIRWGDDGLAFCAGTSVYLVNTSQLVPSEPPADLAVTVQASPNPASVAGLLSYTVEVTNHGPNAARNALITATLSDQQTIQSTAASAGTPVTVEGIVTLPLEDLPAGDTATLTIVVSPQSAGSLSCRATASSNAVDPDGTNDLASKIVSVGFTGGPDTVNELRVTANNILYDPTRKVFWLTIPSTVEAPMSRSLVSVDPINGLVSDPIPINANPRSQSMALSPNGRYLYIGLSDVSEVHRVDLDASPATSIRIVLGPSQWGGANYAQDIEVLDGDGTSFIMVGSSDHSAAVYDGTVMRPNRSGIYTVDRIERTTTANVFVGYNNYTSGFGTTRLSVTATGVAITETVSNLISGYYREIAGSGDLLLASSGVLADSRTLTLIANLGLSGRPCVDSLYQRAYLVNGNLLQGFNIATGSVEAVLTLPTTSVGDWAQSCVRWGADGLAVLGPDKLYVARWSGTIPAQADANANGLADAWEAFHFGAIGVSPTGDADGDGMANMFEHFMVTPPMAANASPTQTSTSVEDGQMMIHLVYPRRAGIASSLYAYECSPDLQNWGAPSSVTETVLSTQTVAGTEVEIVRATIRSPSADGCFVRVKLRGP